MAAQTGRIDAEAGKSSLLLGTAGVIVTRVLVPLWLLSGAVLKLLDGSPSNLPSVLVKALGGSGIDLMFVLQLSIVVELVVVGIAWLLPQLARPATLVLLGAFLPVLVGDLVLGSSSCGCFGAVQVHPAVTAGMDLAFFLAVLLLGRHAPSLRVPRSLPVGRTVAAGLWMLAAVAVGFGAVSRPAAGEKSGTGTVSEGAPAALPEAGYHVPDYASWIGKDWDEVPIARWISEMPDGADHGTHYVLFYRKDCEHCHELMEIFFSPPLQWPTTAVAVPERDGFPTEGVLPMPCEECSRAELPAGVDWFMATPVLVRLTDGVVECAAEVDAADPECLQWESGG